MLRPSGSAARHERVEHALRAKRDVWGEELLAAPAGPTFEGARSYLPPLLYARAAKQTPLTESGVHYVAFSQPAGPQGAGPVVLHVADGSQLISQDVDGAGSPSGSARTGASATAPASSG